MNLSCLFGHSFVELEEKNIFELNGDKNYWYKVKITICKICEKQQQIEKIQIEQRYYENELARLFYIKEKDASYEINPNFYEPAKTRFINTMILLKNEV